MLLLPPSLAGKVAGKMVLADGWMGGWMDGCMGGWMDGWEGRGMRRGSLTSGKGCIDRVWLVILKLFTKQLPPSLKLRGGSRGSR